MRTVYATVAGFMLLVFLVACEGAQHDAIIGAAVVEDATITDSAGEGNLGSVVAGSEAVLFCKTDGSYAVVLPTGTEGDSWSNHDDFPLGYVPATALKPNEEGVPACAGSVHGPDVHSNHDTPTS